MEHMIDGLLGRLNKDNYYTEVQLEQIKYALQLIVGDISKFIILMTLSALMGYGLEFLYAYIASMLLRVLIGGKHLDTYLGCLLFSFVYFTVLILITALLPIQYYHYLAWLAIIYTIILIMIAPRISKKSGRNFKRNIVKIKLFTSLLACLYILCFVVKKEPIYAIGPLTIIFQTVQLLMMKGGSYYEIRKKTKIST